MMKRFLILIIWLGGFAEYTMAQTGGGNGIKGLQDSLVRLGYVIYNNPSEPERIKANFSFVKTLVAALKAPHSYRFDFDSLDMVSILVSPDDRFRIFSWHLQLNDGSYRYYGAIQLNTPDGSLQLYPLLDKTYEIQAPETAVTTPESWYGAQYYRIIPLDDSYVLLGWKGHNPHLTQKVIEVLQLTSDGARLGKPIFDSESTTGYTRVIYRYSRQASMYLDYDRAAQRLILDHLAPSDDRHEGAYEHYGPDLTYDAWQLTGTGLRLVSDIPLTNPPSPSDELYNDPKKAAGHPKSGLSSP
jgi:hypothetical protein